MHWAYGILNTSNHTLKKIKIKNILHSQRLVNWSLPTLFNFDILMLGPLGHIWKIFNPDQFDQINSIGKGKDITSLGDANQSTSQKYRKPMPNFQQEPLYPSLINNFEKINPRWMIHPPWRGKRQLLSHKLFMQLDQQTIMNWSYYMLWGVV